MLANPVGAVLFVFAVSTFGYTVATSRRGKAFLINRAEEIVGGIAEQMRAVLFIGTISAKLTRDH